MTQARTCHVWVRPAYGVGRARPGLVLDWRRVESRTAGAQWQALVVVRDPAGAGAEMRWYFAEELVPVESSPPGPVKPGFAAYGQRL